MEWFAVPMNKHLAALGLGGAFVFVLVTNDTLELRGETSGNVHFAPQQISQVRVGFSESKNGKHWLTKIWTSPDARPIELRPTAATRASYAVVVTRFVELMSAHDRRDRIETGSSKFDALFGPVLMGIPAFGAVAIALLILENEPWWGRMLVPLIPLLIFAILAWRARAIFWPRTLVSVEQLAKHLPPRA